MNKLFLDSGKGQVQIAELALVTGKEQLVIGNESRDLILKTAGNILIQVANKFYTLNFKGATDTTTNTVTSNVTLLDKDTDLPTLVYPGDGQFVYVKQSQSFYIAVATGYVKLNGTGGSTSTNSTLYLSYNTQQTINGAQKNQLLLNAGVNIASFSDIANYTVADVYPNQLIYNTSTGKYYRLTNPTSPATSASWSEAFLSLIDGGTVNNNVTITTTGNALNITGDATLTMGGAKTGLTLNTDQVNITFLNQGARTRSGYIFNTTLDDGTVFTPLTVQSMNAALFGNIDYNYNLVVNGTSNFSDIIATVKGLYSPDYSPGLLGRGYSVYKDLNNNSWTLEIDNVLARKQLSDKSSFYSRSIDGSFWSNPGVSITSFETTGNVTVYGLANKLGTYKDVSGTKVLRTLAEKPRHAQATVPSDITDPTSSTSVQLIKLAYGYGDRNSSGTVVSDSTFFRELDLTTYSVPTGTHDLVSGAFVANPGGAYIVQQSINIIQIITPSYAACVVGDLLFYQSWNPDTSEFQRALLEVISIDTAAGGIYVYAYGSSQLMINQQLIRVGNTLSSANNGIHFNGIDLVGDYIEHLINVTSFRDLYSNIFMNEDGYEVLTDPYAPATINTATKLGTLNNLKDDDLLLGQTSQVGLYSSNAFIKGNIVTSNGKIGTAHLINGVLFTDSTTHPNTYYNDSLVSALFGTTNAGVFIDLKNTRFSLGDTLKYESGALTIRPIVLTSEVTGVLPIANGGTNSSTALTNGKVIVSTGGKIVESSITTTTLAYLDATSSIQTQLNNKQSTIESGVATLVNGMVVVTSTTVVATSKIILTYKGALTTPSILTTRTIVNNTSFVIDTYDPTAAGTNTADNNTVSWIVIN